MLRETNGGAAAVRQTGRARSGRREMRRGVRTYTPCRFSSFAVHFLNFVCTSVAPLRVSAGQHHDGARRCIGNAVLRETNGGAAAVRQTGRARSGRREMRRGVRTYTPVGSQVSLHFLNFVCTSVAPLRVSAGQHHDGARRCIGNAVLRETLSVTASGVYNTAPSNDQNLWMTLGEGA